MDRGRSSGRGYRCGVLVHLRTHPHPPARRFSRNANGLYRLSAQAQRLFRNESGERCPAVGVEEVVLRQQPNWHVIGLPTGAGLMQLRTLSLFAFTVCCFCPVTFAADRDFNGRWDISTTNDPRKRAWWLEIEGAGSPTPSGKFISAYGGDLNVIDSLKIGGGEIEFSFTKSKNV